MVLDHVTQLANFIVVRPATLNTDHFTNSNLYVINTGIVPLAIDGYLQTEVPIDSDSFFTQVMID